MNKNILISLIFIKLVGVFVATEIFHKFSPLVDSNLYIDGYFFKHIGESRLIHGGGLVLRTIFLQYLTYFLGMIFNKFLIHYFFSLISVIGFIYYYLAGGKKLIYLIFLCLPSSFIWTSVVGKEALFFGTFSSCIFLWGTYIQRSLNLKELIFLTFCMSVCLFLRPHYAISILWIFFVMYIIKNYKENFLIFTLLPLAIIFGTLVLTYQLDNILYLAYDAISNNARSSRFDYFNLTGSYHHDSDHFKKILPLGFIFGIIGPLPTELISRIEFIPFFLEGLLIILFPIIIFTFIINFNFSNKSRCLKIYFLCLLPAILYLMLIHSPFGILNPGSAIRWRVNFETIFYIAPLILFYYYKNNEK